MAVTYTLDPGGSNELKKDESDLVRHNPTLTHTGKGDLRATFTEDRSLDEYAQRQDRLNVELDGAVKWTGFIIGTEHDEDRATTRIQGDGVAKRLEETKPSSLPVTYQNIALADAIDDYWGRTPFTNRTVTAESTTTVATDQTVQSADSDSDWNNELSIGATEAIKVSGGELKQAQTCFTTEAENFDRSDGAIVDPNRTDFSGGSGASLEESDDAVEYDFTLDHEIPSGEFTVFVRFEGPGSAGTQPDVSWKLDGTEISTYSPITSAILHEDISTKGSWSDPGAVSSGSHTLRLEVTSAGTSSLQYDVISPADNRFSYTLDNDNGGSDGFLDGPELFPANQTFETESESVSFNITAVDVTSTWDDTTGNQQIAATLDDSNYLTSDNSTTLDQSFSSQVGRSITVRYTFDRHGSRTTATPQTGFNSQAIDSATVKVDGDDLTVIDDLDLTRNHFDNLKTLHDFGDFLWVIEHESGSYSNLTVSSFERGDETRSAPSEWDNPQNKNARVQAGQYFNSVYLEGAKDDQGNRPSTTLDDTSAINNAREKIQAFLRDLEVTTDAGATFRARSLLNTATSNNDLVGTITAPPNVIDPGYARSVDLGDGAKDKTVETVSLTQQNGQLTATYEFRVREGFAEEISELKRNTRSLENQV